MRTKKQLSIEELKKQIAEEKSKLKEDELRSELESELKDLRLKNSRLGKISRKISKGASTIGGGIDKMGKDVKQNGFFPKGEGFSINPKMLDFGGVPDFNTEKKKRKSQLPIHVSGKVSATGYCLAFHLPSHYIAINEKRKAFKIAIAFISVRKLAKRKKKKKDETTEESDTTESIEQAGGGTFEGIDMDLW